MKTTAQTHQQRRDAYAIILEQLRSLLEGETNLVANLANAAALLFHALEEVNWLGFYLYEHEQGELIVGPFQGQPACIRIAPGKGVCGTAAQQQRTVRVANVHAFPGHIACDPTSNAEIVLPLIKDGRLLGVLDIDSPREDRFDDLDQECLERIVNQGILPFWPAPQ